MDAKILIPWHYWTGRVPCIPHCLFQMSAVIILCCQRAAFVMDLRDFCSAFLCHYETSLMMQYVGGTSCTFCHSLLREYRSKGHLSIECTYQPIASLALCDVTALDPMPHPVIYCHIASSFECDDIYGWPKEHMSVCCCSGCLRL